MNFIPNYTYFFSYFGSIKLIFETEVVGDEGPISMSSIIRGIEGFETSKSTFFTGLDEESNPFKIKTITNKLHKA